MTIIITFLFFKYLLRFVGSKPHENQTATSAGMSLPSFMPALRNNFIGSLNSTGNNHSSQDFTKVGEMKREGVLSQKSAEKRPRKARPAKKKGEDGPGSSSSSSAASSSGLWPDGGTEGASGDPGAAGDPSVSAEGDAKVKVKRKYVRPAKQKADAAGAAADGGVAGEGGDLAAAGDGSGVRGEAKAESKSGEREEGGEEGEDDATSGVKRKREGTGRGSRGGKARGVGRGQKALSSPNTAKRLKSGSPFPESGPGEGLTAVKEEVCSNVQ